MAGPVIPYRWLGAHIDVRAALIDEHGWCFAIEDLARGGSVDVDQVPTVRRVIAADLVDRAGEPIGWLPAAAALEWAWSLIVLNLWEWLTEIVGTLAVDGAEVVAAAQHSAPGLLAPVTFDVAGAARTLSSDPALRLGRDGLFEAMAALGWVARPHPEADWTPAEATVRAGHVIVRPKRVPGRRDLYPQIRITPDGVRALHRALGGLGDVEHLLDPSRTAPPALV